MKVIWEAKDINPGRKYSKPGIETWIIGYMANMHSTDRYVSISISDGMVTKPKTKEDMAEDLTTSGYLPVELL